MSELRERLKEEFTDREYRVAYAEDFLNTSIATQIKVLRDKREMTQAQLGQLVGTPQEGISRIENVNYSGWNVTTLQKVAYALDVRLKVSFETFGSLLEECDEFSRESLEKPEFKDDPDFVEAVEEVESNLLEFPTTFTETRIEKDISTETESVQQLFASRTS